MVKFSVQYFGGVSTILPTHPNKNPSRGILYFSIVYFLSSSLFIEELILKGL